MTVAADLHKMPENDRIRMIGASVMNKLASSADRYIFKLQAMFPGLRVVDRKPGPVPNTIMVRIAGPLR